MVPKYGHLNANADCLSSTVSRNLSGGEGDHIQLAKLLKSGANIIILNKQTNDLCENSKELVGGTSQLCGMHHGGIAQLELPGLNQTLFLASKVIATGFFFEGNYTKYEENRLQRLGETIIWCIKYAPLVNAEKMPHAPAGVPWFEQTKLDRWSG